MKTTVLMILDGFGINKRKDFNAIENANKPNLDKIMKKYPWVYGYASGLDVGLPEGQMGNSEVGHLNIGAGRIVYQELTRITKSIEDGDFFENEELLKAVKNCKEKNSALHIMGLVSDGGVHSHLNHLYAVLDLAKRNGLTKVFVHAFLDGRDVPPNSGINFIRVLEEKMRAMEIGQISTVMGRYYSMDRDNRWERVQRAYDAMTMGTGERYSSAEEAVAKSYENGVTDEFVIPSNIEDGEGNCVSLVNGEDSVIFFNFRPDRAREITRTFCDKEFSGFERKKNVTEAVFVCLTEYDKTIENKLVAYKQQTLENTLGEYLSSLGKSQLRIAETEKYAHVTFFFNGGVEVPYKGEDRILIPSPKIATYDLQPEMSAFEVTDKLVESIKAQKYDLIIVNYANPDMVGHTGVMDAAVKAIEAVDTCIGRVYDALIEVKGQMFLCADHGNSDQMIDYETGTPHTAHTVNPVPFMLINYADGIGLKEGGKLADIAPTLLEMMNLPVPKEMTGKSLLISK